MFSKKININKKEIDIAQLVAIVKSVQALIQQKKRFK